MELNFDKLFKISTVALNLNRAHPYIKRDKKWFLQTAIMHGFFTLVFCLMMYNIIYHDLKINNFSQTCKNGVLSIVYVVVTFQYCVLLYQQKSLIQLINFVKKDYELSKNLTSDEQIVVRDYANKGLYVCKQWLVISIVGSSSFLVKNLSLMAYYYCTNEFRLIPFYDLIYPEIIEKRKDNFYIYLMTYLSLVIYAIYASVMYAAYVPLGPIMMLHASGQLEIVKTRIDKLFVEVDDAVIKVKLKGIIEQLQYIYTFVDIIKDVFKIAYELTLKATTIILPVTFYEVIEATKRGELSLEFITFIFGGVLISSSPCYYSDLLMEKGENVRQSLYSCGWEQHYDRATRATLQILLLYALRPIAIRTVFRTLCLDALTDLFQQSYTIFNLMNAMWE